MFKTKPRYLIKDLTHINIIQSKENMYYVKLPIFINKTITNVVYKLSEYRLLDEGTISCADDRGHESEFAHIEIWFTKKPRKDTIVAWYYLCIGIIYGITTFHISPNKAPRSRSPMNLVKRGFGKGWLD